jgi:hypothetical protein
MAHCVRWRFFLFRFRPERVEIYKFLLSKQAKILCGVSLQERKQYYEKNYDHRRRYIERV